MINRLLLNYNVIKLKILTFVRPLGCSFLLSWRNYIVLSVIDISGKAKDPQRDRALQTAISTTPGMRSVEKRQSRSILRRAVIIVTIDSISFIDNFV